MELIKEKKDLLHHIRLSKSVKSDKILENFNGCQQCLELGLAVQSTQQHNDIDRNKYNISIASCD